MSVEKPPAEQDGPHATGPTSTNHVVWGMTIGVLLGSASGFFVFSNVAVGVAIGVALGGVLSILLYALNARSRRKP